jgi:hypothetical protein
MHKKRSEMNQNKQAFQTRITAFIFAAISFIACSKDDIIPPTTNPPGPTIPKVEFSVESEAIQEGSYQLVQLNFNNKTSKSEKLVVSLSSTNLEYGTHYITEPAAVNGKVTLEIASGAENAFIKVIPVNNDSKDDVRELLFTIASEGTTLEPFGKKNSKLVFIDDDTKSVLAFSDIAASIFENNGEGYEIKINITPQSEVNGHIEITFLSNDQYGTSWTSIPAAQNNRIRIPVQQGADKASFRIKPVNDFLLNSDRTIRFNVSSASTNFTLPVKNEFNLTINNDDVEYGPVSIANIRRSYNGQEMYFVFDAFVTGTVTSTKDNLDPKMIYIQDETGGIALKLLADYQPAVIGNKVIINLEGGLIKEVNGNLEIHFVSNANISPTGFDIVNVDEMTLQQLYARTNDMEGRIVKINNLSFPDANGTKTLAGNRIATDGTRTLTVRTESFATFANKVIPTGNVSVTGILVEVNGQYIIIPQTENSVR